MIGWSLGITRTANAIEDSRLSPGLHGRQHHQSYRNCCDDLLVCFTWSGAGSDHPPKASGGESPNYWPRHIGLDNQLFLVQKIGICCPGVGCPTVLT